MKKIFIQWIEKMHQLVFRHPMSSEMKVFFGNLSWSFLSGIFVMPLMMVITTLAGRFMGPVEYGKYTLILIVNQFLVIFIFFGLDTTSVKYIAKANKFEDKKKVISTIFTFVCFMLALLAIITLLSYPFLLKYSKTYSSFVILVTYYTLIVSVKVIFDLIIRGIENFKKQAMGKVLEVMVVLAIFLLVFFVLKKQTYTSFLFTINAGALAISIYYFFYLSKYLGKSDKPTLKQQLSEGKLFFISALLGTLFLSADRLVVGKYMGVKMLGIYSAYYFASYGVVSQVTQLFTNVFFPVTSRLKDKSFAKKIDQLLLIGIIPFSLFFSVIMLVMLMIFGKQYPITTMYVLGFSLFSSLYFFQALYNTVIVDVSKAEYKKYLFIMNGVNLITLAIYIIAIFLHLISIPIILAALISNLLIKIYIQRLFIRSMQHERLL